MKFLLLLCFLQAPILKPPADAIAPEHTSPANLDFEAGATAGVPDVWNLAQESRISGYSLELRSEGCRTGKGCAAIVAGNQVEAHQVGAIFQEFSAEQYLNKRMRFSAWVKLDGSESDARIRVSFAAPSESRAAEFVQKGSVRSHEWTLAQVEGKVPAKAEMINLLITVSGQGSALIDDASFELIQ